MAITIWRGYKDWNDGSDFETVTYEDAVELGSVRFTDEEADIQYKVFRYEDGIIIHFVERKGHYVEAEVFEYPDLETAAEQYRFVLKKAGVI